MIFGTNRTPIEVIKERAFRGTYFRDIHSGTNSKLYRNSWKKCDELKNIDKKYHCSNNIIMLMFIKYKVKCGASLIFGENKGFCDYSISPRTRQILLR